MQVVTGACVGMPSPTSGILVEHPAPAAVAGAPVELLVAVEVAVGFAGGCEDGLFWAVVRIALVESKIAKAKRQDRAIIDIGTPPGEARVLSNAPSENGAREGWDDIYPVKDFFSTHF
jgi:hypothetical protein